jgi:CheY-like chemotaxis protein
MPAGQQERKRVLIVDDCAATRDLLTIILEVEGYEVVCAANGREALAQLRRAPAPDVVLLDLMMPVMSGSELLEVMKQNSRLAPIPVVVFSAVGDLEPDPLSLGAAACLTKPISEDSVIDRVVSALNAALPPDTPSAGGGP